MGITWWLMWQVPPFLQDQPVLKFFYYLITAMAFSTAHTCVAVPYAALTADLSIHINQDRLYSI
jgi:Na+/melibiose symporter-like transporter